VVPGFKIFGKKFCRHDKASRFTLCRSDAPQEQAGTACSPVSKASRLTSSAQNETVCLLRGNENISIEDRGPQLSQALSYFAALDKKQRCEIRCCFFGLNRSQGRSEKVHIELKFLHVGLTPLERCPKCGQLLWKCKSKLDRAKWLRMGNHGPMENGSALLCLCCKDIVGYEIPLFHVAHSLA
jgi:hypothetical protein